MTSARTAYALRRLSASLQPGGSGICGSVKEVADLAKAAAAQIERWQQNYCDAVRQRDHARRLLREWAAMFPAFRAKPLGEPGSSEREQQRAHMGLEDQTLTSFGASAQAEDAEPSRDIDLLAEIRDLLKEQYLCGHGIRGFCPFCLKSEKPG